MAKISVHQYASFTFMLVFFCGNLLSTSYGSQYVYDVDEAQRHVYIQLLFVTVLIIVTSFSIIKRLSILPCLKADVYRCVSVFVNEAILCAVVLRRQVRTCTTIVSCIYQSIQIYVKTVLAFCGLLLYIVKIFTSFSICRIKLT